MIDYGRTHSGFEPVAPAYAQLLWEQAHPFHLTGEQRADTIVVGAHGFSATPYELKPVLEACRRAGFDAVAPLLQGHGYRDRAHQARAIRWLYPRSVEQALVNEIGRCRSLGYERILLYGHSMGGALALRLAALGLADGVAVTAPAIELPALAVLTHFVPPFFDLELESPTERGVENLTYVVDSVHAVAKVHEIAARARAVLTSLRCPALVVHTRGDATISPRVGDLVQARSQGPVERVWFDESGHCMTLDVAGAQVAAAVADFFGGL